MKVKAAINYEFGTHLEVEDVDMDPPGEGEARIKVAFCAICHSDIHSMKGEHPQFNPKLPAIGGHEVAGHVDEIGKGVTYVKTGDPVIVTIPSVGCGHCYMCTIGKPFLCENRGFKFSSPGPYITKKGQRLTQFAGAMSGFVEYTNALEGNIVKVPEDMPLDSASILACAVISGFGAVVNKAQVKPFSSVVVMGTGGVGLNAIQGAVYSGAFPVIAVDVVDKKLELAKEFGATYTVNASKEEDPIGVVRKLTSGRGADYVFITVAGNAPLRQGFLMSGMDGITVAIGHAGEQYLSDFEVTEFVGGKTLTGCGMGQTRPRIDIPRLIDLYQAGYLKLDELLDQRYPLDKINEALESCLKGETLRNIIVFQ
jgi:S-(hydroxymethyl)glutathione dehydrogenase/alcohol dehydrogenase